jgi:hypothetical protein
MLALRVARRVGRLGLVRVPPAPARRIARWIDRVLPGESSCYRRVVLTVLLDPEAARQRIGLGLRRGAAPRSGHVWIGPKDTTDTFDVELYIDP